MNWSVMILSAALGGAYLYCAAAGTPPHTLPLAVRVPLLLATALFPAVVVLEARYTQSQVRAAALREAMRREPRRRPPPRDGEGSGCAGDEGDDLERLYR